MKFICPLCKKTVERDMRLAISKAFKVKGGYRGRCDKYDRDVTLRELTTKDK
jgi:hypothetical protein